MLLFFSPDCVCVIQLQALGGVYIYNTCNNNFNKGSLFFQPYRKHFKIEIENVFKNLQRLKHCDLLLFVEKCLTFNPKRLLQL